MILLLLFNYALATHNITCILLAAPKKIPMLTYTIDYFLNAYNHYHKGIEIEEFYLVKGTDQPFPDIDKAAKKLRESGINVNDDIPLYDWKEGTDVFEKFKNYYTRFWAEYSYNFWKKQRFSWINKDSVINYYNYQVIEKIFKKKNDYPDYLLFIEDDVAMKKTFFIELEKQLNVKYNDESALKLAFPPYYNTDTVGYFTNKHNCVWGFFGVLLNKEQQRNWLRLAHFLPFGYCGDQFHCMMVWWFDKRVRLHGLWYHFGRDKNIVPRIKKYWS